MPPPPSLARRPQLQRGGRRRRWRWTRHGGSRAGACGTRKRQAIFSDPNNLTADWVGPGVCNYTSVYCASLPSGPDRRGALVVAEVNLNHGDIVGFLP
uniref:Uncharacterized protein n=1 Tax=Zea mays TaxID=4577 RepID=A0A804M5C3_MAIZE